VVIAVSADKQVAGIVRPIAARAALVVATEAPSSRALPAAALAEVCERFAPRRTVVEPSWPAALARGRAAAASSWSRLAVPGRGRARHAPRRGGRTACGWPTGKGFTAVGHGVK